MNPPEPEREPRPKDADGSFRCYREGCGREAGVAAPRRIASSGIDPVQTVVTFCYRCWLSSKTLQYTRSPARGTDADDPDADWQPERLYPRLLANLIYFGDERGRDPPSEDSELGDIFDQAGEIGAEVRHKFETDVRRQLIELDVIQPEDTSAVDLSAFEDGGEP